jgi:hypothetical protein
MPTVVVNLKKESCDVRIDRTGPYGNPFRIGQDGDRKEVIRKFKVHFYEKLNLDPTWLKDVLWLEGKRLGCHCKPLACHGDVYVEFIERWRKNQHDRS